MGNFCSSIVPPTTPSADTPPCAIDFAKTSNWRFSSRKTGCVRALLWEVILPQCGCTTRCPIFSAAGAGFFTPPAWAARARRSPAWHSVLLLFYSLSRTGMGDFRAVDTGRRAPSAAFHRLGDRRRRAFDLADVFRRAHVSVDQKPAAQRVSFPSGRDAAGGDFCQNAQALHHPESRMARDGVFTQKCPRSAPQVGRPDPNRADFLLPSSSQR